MSYEVEATGEMFELYIVKQKLNQIFQKVKGERLPDSKLAANISFSQEAIDGLIEKNSLLADYSCPPWEEMADYNDLLAQQGLIDPQHRYSPELHVKVVKAIVAKPGKI